MLTWSDSDHAGDLYEGFIIAKVAILFPSASPLERYPIVF